VTVPPTVAFSSRSKVSASYSTSPPTLAVGPLDEE